MRLTNSPSSGVCFYIQAIAQILTFPHCLGPSDPPRTPLSLARLSAPLTHLLAPPAVPPPPAPSRRASHPSSPSPSPSGLLRPLPCPRRLGPSDLFFAPRAIPPSPAPSWRPCHLFSPPSRSRRLGHAFSASPSSA